MAKVLQIIDVDASGHKVRLDDGRVIFMPHGGEHPQIGQEISRDAHLGAVSDGPKREETFAPPIKHLQSPAQELAQQLSEVIRAAALQPEGEPIQPDGELKAGDPNALDTAVGTAEGQQGEHTEEAAPLG